MLWSQFSAIFDNFRRKKQFGLSVRLKTQLIRQSVMPKGLFTPSNRVCRATQFSLIRSILFFVVRHFQMSHDTILTDWEQSFVSVVQHFQMSYNTIFTVRITPMFRCITLSDVARHNFDRLGAILCFGCATLSDVVQHNFSCQDHSYVSLYNTFRCCTTQFLLSGSLLCFVV
jgi:hypothetical protein